MLTNSIVGRLASSAVGVVARGCLLTATLGAAMLVTPGSAVGQTILEIDTSTLTTYLGGSTTVQDITPLHLDRGVTIDGSAKSPSAQGWAIAGNPWGESWNRNHRLGDVRLETGGYSPTEIDLALPSIGPRWIVGRSYNGRQTSNGPQGRNWMQLSQPELKFYQGASAGHDVLYIVYGADRFLEFKRSNSESDVFKGKNGAAGVVKRTAGAAGSPNTPEKFEYIDQNGMVTTFFGSTYAGDAAWQLWKVRDTAGNECYVGDSSSMATAISSYDSTSGNQGAIKTAYDQAGHRYTYTYTSLNGDYRLTQVKAELNTGSWVTVGKVDYDYYGTSDANGNAGCLKTVTTATPMTSGSDQVRTHCYRYYTGSWSSTVRGHPDLLKSVLAAEGYRRYDALDSTFDNSPLTATDSQLSTYLAAAFEYESSSSTKRLSRATFNGECGCSGGTNGAYDFAYSSSSLSLTTSYDVGWAFRTLVAQPDGTWITQYFDETGQPLARVLSDGDPGNEGTTDFWVTDVRRSTAGCITDVHTPANNTAYHHDSTSGVIESTSTDLVETSSTLGLVYTTSRVSSGDLTGFVTDRNWKVGSSGTINYLSATSYTSRTYTGTTPNVVRPLVMTNTEFVTADGTVSNVTTYETSTPGHYLFHSSTSTDPAYLAIKRIKTSYPIVTTANNGPNTATVGFQYFNTDGTPSFAKMPDGIISFRKYDALTGQITMSIDDVYMSSTDLSGVTNPDSGELTADSAAIHNKTTFTYDTQGRSRLAVLPNGRVTLTEYVALDDRRLVTLSTPKYVDATTDLFYGPASYRITTHAGSSEAQGSIGFSGGTSTTAPAGWVTASGNDYSCISTGSVLRLSTTIYNNAGNQVNETRTYTKFTGMTFPGTSGTHFDATTLAYDPLGRRWRVKDPTGTIDRTVFDALGRPVEQWTGTNDNSWSGGESSGTSNMVKIAATEYDAGSAGKNSHATKRTQYVQDSTTDQRVVSYINDDRGRVVVTTNPLAPHTVAAYDNLGRMTGVAQYDDTTGFSAATAPTEESGRVGYQTTSFDQKSQVFRRVRHKIDQVNGDSEDSLSSDSWYDAVGRRVKVQGEELSKTTYDRLGRPTHRFVVAQARNSSGSAETAYADADDVADDLVLEEQQTVYEVTTGNVLFTASIGRHPNESSGHYGARDRNEDNDRTTITAGDVLGRIQISTNWYDALDRLASTVDYGTNLIIGDDAADATHNFTRPGSAPTGDATKLRTDYSYPDERVLLLDLTGTSNDVYGTYRDVTDANGKIARTWLDDAGRQIATIANYIDGDPTTGSGNDTDVTTRYVYSEGLQTKVWVDLDGDNTEDTGTPYDQVTEYDYGVTKGTTAGTSRITSNRLLYKVVFPPQYTSPSVQPQADRTMVYAYNALGQQIYREDQAGNVITDAYDTAGRLTTRSADTIASGFDTTVQSIVVAYNSRGLTETVTQYDVGDAATDQVKFHYDGWTSPNLVKFEQDVDSEIGGGGRAAFDVEYAFSKNIPDKGRWTLRRSSMTMPNGDTMTYNYSSGMNSDASRVSSLTANSVSLAQYFYTGAGMMAETVLPEPAIEQQLYGSTFGTYPDMDRFNRITSNRWTKLGVNIDFHDVDLAYNNTGQVVRTVDNIQLTGAGQHAFDRVYTLDGRYRVTSTAEGHITGGISGTAVATGEETRTELWTLGLTGVFNTNKLDLDGEQDYSDFGSGEVDDLRTNSPRNQPITWRPAGSGGSTYSIVHDRVGNVSSDGRDYKFKHDPFGRLVEVSDSDDVVLTQYRHNGLCHWIASRAAGVVEELVGDNPWYYRCNDESGNLAAVYRETDAYPKEQFYRHAGGLNGFGGAGGGGYNRSVILRDKDTSTDWGSAADSTLDERRYMLHDTLGSVCGVLTDLGYQLETVRYFSYGAPFGLPASDLDADGDFDTDDYNDLKYWSSGYDVRADINLDSFVDGSDLIEAPAEGTTLGRGRLSRVDVGNRFGWMGHQTDGVLDRFLHSQVWDTELAINISSASAEMCIGPIDFTIPPPGCKNCLVPPEIPWNPYDNASCPTGWYYDALRDQCVQGFKPGYFKPGYQYDNPFAPGFTRPTTPPTNPPSAPPPPAWLKPPSVPGNGPTSPPPTPPLILYPYPKQTQLPGGEWDLPIDKQYRPEPRDFFDIVWPPTRRPNWLEDPNQNPNHWWNLVPHQPEPVIPKPQSPQIP